MATSSERALLVIESHLAPNCLQVLRSIFLMSFMKNDVFLPITEDIFPGRYAVEHVAFTT